MRGPHHATPPCRRGKGAPLAATDRHEPQTTQREYTESTTPDMYETPSFPVCVFCVVCGKESVSLFSGVV
jgi:hypothetical protein